jgi:hypothetical protein
VFLAAFNARSAVESNAASNSCRPIVLYPNKNENMK